MDDKQVKILEKDVHEFLMQLSMELEASAEAAKKAAEYFSETDRQNAWTYVQQMYARLSQANHLLQRFKSTIDYAVELDEAAHKNYEKSRNL